jgi:hypothetical protein
VTGSEDFDELIMLLAAAGVGLSGTGMLNGCNALAKNTVKYLDKIPCVANIRVSESSCKQGHV